MMVHKCADAGAPTAHSKQLYNATTFRGNKKVKDKVK